jgi:serine/threonine-protein kinase
MFSPGDTVGGYVIEERLGAGGFGEVFRATERSPRRQVALKFVRPELAADPLFMRRFEHEVNAMARVEHPNVVPIYTTHEEDRGLPYFAMRYVAGGSLATLLEEHPPLEVILDVLAGVAEGLDCCHARGVVHRDLKPANVLVEAETGRGLLTDFGIALAEGHTTVTGPGLLVGTRPYMAPETLMGERATPASDLWALGAMAYRAAANALPRGPEDAPETAPLPPSRRNHRVGPDVDRVILRALSLDPALRHEDARTFVADLRDALERTKPTSPSPARGRRGRVMWSLAGAALLLTPVAAYGLSSLVDGSPSCHPSYTGACLNPDSLDYDCASGGGDGPDYLATKVRVVGRDDYELDGNRDGFAC